jgi:hypothetical protein
MTSRVSGHKFGPERLDKLPCQLDPSKFRQQEQTTLRRTETVQLDLVLRQKLF